MSKILNRPMFRGGGKVSSYGNGITTGLADGGRVNFQHGGTHSGKSLEPFTYDQLVEKRKLSEGNVYKDDLIRERYNQFKNQFFVDPTTYDQEIVGPDDQFQDDNFYLSDKNKDMLSFLQANPDENGLAFQNFISAKGPFGKGQDFEGIDYVSKQQNQKKVSPELFLNDTLSNKEIIEEPEAKVLAGSQVKKLTDEEKLAEVEKEQAFFEKLLGGGKSAKIQDASDMAISFASKALGEGATVKSAFGDFLADETKRPSRRMKVKDAATQAAIQSYLTNKTSYQKFQDQIGIAQAGMDMKTEALRPKNLSEAFTSIMKPGDKATDPGIMSRATEIIYGVDSFVGELKPDVELIVGKVYYGDAKDKSSNKILYLIDKNGEPQFLKTVYR